MPIYEYRCAACGHHLEALQKMTEGPLRKCPDCGKSQLKRLVSASRFRLKGSGWYETDFKNKGETQRNLVEKGGGESTEAASDKSTDTSAKTGTAKPPRRQGRRRRERRRCGGEAREAETASTQTRVADANQICGQAARENLAPLTRSRPRRARCLRLDRARVRALARSYAFAVTSRPLRG